jgi:lysylphosphatidylglycerol synthetase-like protein (DUF2156 family)
MTGVPLETRIALLRQHGSFSQAYSVAFQAGLRHFGDERGFIAYKTVWGTAMALSDPLAPKQAVGNLIARFCRENPDVAFWQISRPVAEILAALGFFTNEMGPDTCIALAGYDLSGRAKHNLRNARNRMNNLGYNTRESTIRSVGADKVKAVSDAWRQTRTVRRREVGFLSRPMVIDDEPDVRAFFTFDRAGELVAFSIFDPIYQSGEVVGYTAQHNRYGPGCDALVQVATKCHAIETFQAEGRKWLSLGLSPFADVRDQDFHHDRWARKAFRGCYKNPLFNRFIYPLQGHATHKRQFRGVQEQTYFAFNRRPSVPRIAKVLWACGIF